MSPVRTATRSSRGNAARVFSSSVVFPEPGELIRLTTRTLFSRKRSRNSAATRSFSLRTFFSSGTRFILLQLDIGQLQFFSADALVAIGATSRANENEVFHVELRATLQTTMPARTKLNFEFQPLKVRLSGQRFEAEAQCVGIDGGQLADAQAHFHRFAVTLRRFRLHRFEHGLCDTEFVHNS